jgi:hypothetical protein
MNQISPSLERLIAALGEDIGLTGREIADIFWLLYQCEDWEKAGSASLLTADSSPDQTLESGTAPPNVSPPPPSIPLPVEIEVYAATGSVEEKSQASENLSLPVPDVSPLGEPLNLARALRPLMQKVASGQEWLIDEQATAERIAEERLRLPVLKPGLEPWLDVALVVDESASMIFWRQTAANLQHLLEHYGVFRDVRAWGLGTDAQGKLSLRRGFGKKAQFQRSSSLREIIDPSGRRLILIVSDCVSEIWRNGQAIEGLKIWSKHGPMAILQMLPQWLWLRTGLNLGASVQLSSLSPGVANQSLSIDKILLWDAIDFDRGIKVPVLTLEPEMAAPWSQMVAGRSNVGVAGVVFPGEGEIEVEAEYGGEETAQERVDNFQ